MRGNLELQVSESLFAITKGRLTSCKRYHSFLFILLTETITVAMCLLQLRSRLSRLTRSLADRDALLQEVLHDESGTRPPSEPSLRQRNSMPNSFDIPRAGSFVENNGNSSIPRRTFKPWKTISKLWKWRGNSSSNATSRDNTPGNPFANEIIFFTVIFHA